MQREYLVELSKENEKRKFWLAKAFSCESGLTLSLVC